MTYNQIVVVVYIAYIVLISLITFCLFLKDKKMAQKNHSEVRIKEKTLLSSVAFGGAIGGFFGRIVAHHKTDKKYFSFTIYLSLILQIAIAVVLIILALK